MSWPAPATSRRCARGSRDGRDPQRVGAPTVLVPGNAESELERWSFDLSEDEAAARLESCPEGAVLVLHSPPNGFLDEAHGRHLGSRSILAAIERKGPVLAFCGYIHQCWGREAVIGTTPVVNVGPDGRFFEI